MKWLAALLVRLVLVVLSLAVVLFAFACGGNGPPVQDIQTLCLEVEQSYPQIEEEFAEPIAEAVRHTLAGLGLQVVAVGTPCDATLTFTLTGTALGASYGGAHATIVTPGRQSGVR